MYDWLTLLRACQMHHNRTEDPPPMPQKPDRVVELLKAAQAEQLSGEHLSSLALSAQAIVIVLTRIAAELAMVNEMLTNNTGHAM